MLTCFNPRICKRCDRRAYPKQIKLIVSIHASVKDATPPADVAGHIMGFNPRICKRCDDNQQISGHERPCFNPRICKRCDSMFVKSFIDDTFKL